MKLAKESKLLLNFFNDNNLNKIKLTKETAQIITELYENMLKGYIFLSKMNLTNKIITKQITNIGQITKPKMFNVNSFPERIRKHIDENSVYEICYTFSLFNRDIKLFFIVEETSNFAITTYNKYVKAIALWICMLSIYSSNRCAKTLSVYLYFTSLTKELPQTNVTILDEHNVNTAFTTSCPKDSEIVIFRKEEWFKVFIHETFHNFGLDFSDMNINESTKYILKLFPVKSEVNLYEAYTEFWAEIINACFCSFYSIKNKKNIGEFLSYVDLYINFERTYSCFQLVKTLNFMGLKYSDLYLNNNKSKLLRENMYKENSNVLSYYVIKCILMNNFNGFLMWCKTHNFSLLQFNKTIANQIEFCRFIEQNYKTRDMLRSISYMDSLYNNIIREKSNNKKSNKSFKYLMTNMRMSICELG